MRLSRIDEGVWSCPDRDELVTKFRVQCTVCNVETEIDEHLYNHLRSKQQELEGC